MGFDEKSGREDERIAGLPRCVKVFAAIGLIILAALAIMIASGHHGPGRHL